LGKHTTKARKSAIGAGDRRKVRSTAISTKRKNSKLDYDLKRSLFGRRPSRPDPWPKRKRPSDFYVQCLRGNGRGGGEKSGSLTTIVKTGTLVGQTKIDTIPGNR